MLKQKEREDLLKAIDDVVLEPKHGSAILLSLEVQEPDYDKVRTYLTSNSQKYGKLVPSPMIPPHLEIMSTKEQARRLVNEIYNNKNILRKITHIEVFENLFEDSLIENYFL